jgi:hypothetical protein
MEAEENIQSEEVNNQSNINWKGLGLQTCITVASAFIGGFAAAGGAFAFSQLVGKPSDINDLTNVVELKRKVV